VTGGGIALDETDTKSMESLKAPGVFVCGEVCDVFGRIGGFNFLWAWTSGRLAGVSAAKRVNETGWSGGGGGDGEAGHVAVSEQAATFLFAKHCL